jgi:hypothetical protein
MTTLSLYDISICQCLTGQPRTEQHRYRSASCFLSEKEHSDYQEIYADSTLLVGLPGLEHGNKKQPTATNRNKPQLSVTNSTQPQQTATKKHKKQLTATKKTQFTKMVGLERFELSSIAPEATSLDQASRQPQRAIAALLH